MTPFGQRVLEAVRGKAERRRRLLRLRRMLDPRARSRPAPSREAYLAAVFEVAERWPRSARQAFLDDGRLPWTFWQDVDRVAAERGSMPR